METYKGHITYVRFHSADSKYTVATFQPEEMAGRMTIVGSFADPNEDDTYTITGEFTMHPRYGEQFQVHNYEVEMAAGRRELIRYLSSDQFPGIGEKLATRIADTLGDEAITKIVTDPACLDDIPQLSKDKADLIASVLKDKSFDQEVTRFFLSHGLSMRHLNTLKSVYQNSVLQVLETNPYRPMQDIEGIGFKTVDQMGKALGVRDDDPRRLKAAVLDALVQYCFRTGSTYAYYDDIRNMARRFAGMKDESFVSASLGELIQDGSVVEEDERFYTGLLYEAECTIARRLKRFSHRRAIDVDDDALETAIERAQERFGIDYDDTQKDAIRSIMTSPALIVTGGPGTGKTTIVRAILDVYKSFYPKDIVKCAAPTGRAAKRMSELTGEEASTIHRLLCWDIASGTAVMDENNPIEADFLIVDEFSMVDTVVLAKLLDASVRVKKLLIIGDDAQLPSVSPGCVLKDLLQSGVMTSVALEKIHRQHEHSGIIALSHQLREGMFDPQVFEGKDDIFFRPCPPDQVVSWIMGLVEEKLNDGFDMFDIQIIAPMYKYTAGVDELNAAAQSLMNPRSPEKKELSFNRKIFREGDKVMQLVNMTSDNVFNGDMGVIDRIYRLDSEDYIDVEFDSAVMTYNRAALTQLTLAYAVSVHKSQGSEFPIVIMPLMHEHRYMLRRNLVYTALTRAKSRLYLAGDMGLLAESARRVGEDDRRTTLCARLGGQNEGNDMRISDFE